MAYIDNKLGEGEKIVYTAHQHPLVLLRTAFRPILFFIAGFAGLIASFILIQDANFAGLPKNILMLVCLALMLIGLFGFFLRYLYYINEEYIVTNERVIQVQGVFNKRELDSSLSKVNDVQTYQSIMGRALNYGMVEIVTGNESGINQLDYLSGPFEFKKRMLNAKNGLYGDASDLAPRFEQGGYIRSEDGERRYRVTTQPIQPSTTALHNQHTTPNFPVSGYNPPPSNQSNSQNKSQSELLSLIQELGRLRDDGLITPEEFQAKKNELLRRL